MATQDVAVRIASPGHLLFSLILVALGIQGLVTRDFTQIWAQVPKDVPLRNLLVAACAVITLTSGAGMLWTRTAAVASRVLLASLLLWMLAWRVPVIVRAPRDVLSWDNCAETAAIVAGAWVLYTWLAGEWDRRRLAVASGETGVRIARVFYGLALIPMGLAHFAYPRETAVLVPSYLPGHLAIAYLTGGAFLAASVGVLLGVLPRLAATLSATEIGGFTVLVWVPMILRGSPNAFQWSEFAISWVLTSAAWIVAESYRGKRWLAVGWR